MCVLELGKLRARGTTGPVLGNLSVRSEALEHGCRALEWEIS